MREKKLSLAPEKTEAIVFSGRRKLDPIKFQIEDATVAPKEHIKYLGVWLDKCLNFKKHVEEVAKKAQKLTDALHRLMPTKGGPRASKRRVLASVAHSVILYAAPIFEGAMKIELYRKKLEAVQRRMAIGICGAYRTISTDAVLVIAGLIPIDKMVRERAQLYRDREFTPLEVRGNVLTEWDKEWSGAGKGA
ncbi:uncharacterized protein LOC120634631 [Pararge aegeria]|uniref:uncharacterized protein LOC120634631 n=1 Tax=Pararge aegeria TaxID=116150 RepID=UPI0019D0ED6D|nr:uncharacterized protein LOC120634631 [Pararge aegeria]